MPPELLSILAQGGPLGLFIWYLTRREDRRDKIDLARIETDKAIAGALAALTVLIQRIAPGE